MRRNIFFIILVLVLISCVKNPSNPKDLPESPSDLALTQLDTERILFNWQDNSDNEGGFIVDRKIGSDNWNINYKTFTENTVLFIDSHLTVFDLYSYRLHAYNDDGESDSLACNLNFLDLDSLNIPSNLELHQLENNNIELNWQDNSTGEEGFRIDRKIGNNDWEENYAQTEENCTTFVDSNLTIFDEYSYRLMCFSGETFSDFIEASTILIDHDSLDMPSNLALHQLGENNIELNWQDNSTGEEGFRIDRKIGNNDWEENYFQTEENCTTYIDSNLTIFDEYYYRLMCFSGDIYSDFIEASTILIDHDSLDMPSNLEMHQIDNDIVVNWQDNSTGEEGFRVDRKIGNNAWEENYYQTEENCTIFINSDLTVFDEYFYRVMCFSGDIYSDFVEASILFVDYDSLSAPSNLLLQQWNSDTISLTWLDNSSQEEGFRIDRKIGNNDWEENYAQTDENIESFFDSNLIIYDEYKYKVMSFSNESYSDFIESSITLLDYDSLNAPSNLILDIQDYNIYLSWQDNSSQEDGFRIDRKIGDEEWEENYQIVSPNVTFFNDEDLQIIGNCSYRVAAFIDDSYSNFIEGDIDFYCRDLYSMSSLINEQILLTPYEPFYYIVELFDAYGELVIGDYEVWFQFTTCPDGMSINNQVFGVGDSLSVLSSNGSASVNLYAGSEPGTASIKASAVNAQNMSGSVIKSNIVVYAVLPENIYLDHGGINSGQDMGGGVWQIEVAAIIEDGYGNPGIYGTTVWFSLEDTQIPGMDPDWAVIGAEAYIGNENANGDSLLGVAYTYLNYDGSHTNDSLWVHIQVALPNGYLEETETMIVPLQFGDIEIIASCDSIAWTPNTIEDSLSTNFTILLRDGQNNPINNQQVYFIGSPGHPVDMGTDNDNNAFTELTGISPNTNGHVNKDWTFFRYECPPPVGNEPGTSAATIYIIVPRADVEEELNVTLYRYP